MATSLAGLLVALLWAGIAQAHTVITYPGWRGNNLGMNEAHPFGMGWSYPCGGLAPTQNRTAWPIGGGAIAFQPGWFAGHARNLMYINLGLSADPANYSSPLVERFEIAGPSDNPYPGTVCLPTVRLPDTVRPKKGDLASIQIVQVMKHGAALYSVSPPPPRPPLVSRVRC